MRGVAWSALSLVVVLACSSSDSGGPPIVFGEAGPGPDGGDGASPRTDAPAPPGDAHGTDAPSPAEAGPPDTDVSNSFAGGSRVKAKWYVAADGAQEFAGAWHDTQLDVDCYFRPAGDGTVRCLPLADTPVYYDYADAACTQPLGMHSGCTNPPALMSSTDDSACPSRAHLYAIGLPASAQHYTKPPGGTCTPTTGQSGTTYFTLGPELSPSMYLDATFSNGASQGGVVPVYLAGSDGSRGFDHWNDATMGLSCRFQPAADGNYHCLPASIGSLPNVVAYQYGSSYFTAPSCTGAAFYTQATGCPDPTLGEGTDPMCPQPTHVFRLGPRASGSLYISNAGMCTAQPAPAGFNFFPAGAEIPATTFGSATLAPPSGATRLQENDVLTSAGMRALVGLHDAQLGLDCYVTYASDGQLRCLPSGMFTGLPYYVDAGCTQPIAYWPTGTCGPTPTYASLADQSTCPAHTKLLTLGSPVMTVYYLDPATSACTNVGSIGGGVTYQLGAEVPPVTFEALTVTMK